MKFTYVFIVSSVLVCFQLVDPGSNHPSFREHLEMGGKVSAMRERLKKTEQWLDRAVLPL